jgi:ribosomal protein S18 acetylase RimI-like enzyme
MDNNQHLKTPALLHTRLRAIERKDCDILSSLLRELAASTGLPGQVVSVPSNLEAVAFSESPFIYGTVAENQGQIVGFSLFHRIYSSWRGESGVYLLDLFVKPEAQKLGLGRRLIAHAASRAFDLWGARFIKLDVDLDNTAAQAFYNGLGFEVDSAATSMVMSEPKFDALMSRGF